MRRPVSLPNRTEARREATRPTPRALRRRGWPRRATAGDASPHPRWRTAPAAGARDRTARSASASFRSRFGVPGRNVEEVKLAVSPLQLTRRFQLQHARDQAVGGIENSAWSARWVREPACAGYSRERELEKRVELDAFAAGSRVRRAPSARDAMFPVPARAGIRMGGRAARTRRLRSLKSCPP